MTCIANSLWINESKMNVIEVHCQNAGARDASAPALWAILVIDIGQTNAFQALVDLETLTGKRFDGANPDPLALALAITQEADFDLLVGPEKANRVAKRTGVDNLAVVDRDHDVAFHVAIFKATHNIVWKQLSHILKPSIHLLVETSNVSASDPEQSLERHQRLGRHARNLDGRLSVHADQRTDRAVIVHKTKAALDAASRGYQMLLEDGRVTACLAHMWPYNSIKIRTHQLL